MKLWPLLFLLFFLFWSAIQHFISNLFILKLLWPSIWQFCWWQQTSLLGYRFVNIFLKMLKIIFSCEDAVQQVLMYVCPSVCPSPKLKFFHIVQSVQFQNVPECSRMHAECSRMFQNVPECYRMYAECSRMFPNSCKMFQNVPECMQNVTDCSSRHAECFRRYAECSRMHAECSRMHAECTRMHAECSQMHA